MNRMWSLVFIISGLAVLIYGIGVVRDARNCGTWPKTEGRVTSSDAQVVSREKGRGVYAPNVAYSFQVATKRYESSRLTLVPRNYPSLQQTESILARYPVGAKVTVYYDPKSPENCVLVTTTTGTEWAYALGGALMIGVGIYTWLRG